ncbi:hypothetical protein C5748_27015 [Phyllobacterium phragmitis]|uniref:Uncharacterized protein n=1 Tax=Phyllobacterium phragmitis TaxID=2670329 RepID=A0A2S9IIS3_9HYPH|nr:hypothetical protein [Phyllobacterium phragmitis]PRD40430.1 hypothetical protein C5748_27015 [Phyllobacterium phragmitis]
MSTRTKPTQFARDLSFMSLKIPRGTGIDYWIVEGTGGYGTDCDKGHELALELLSYVAQHPSYGNATLLASIVGCMITRHEVQEKGRLTGIEIAFLNRVSLHAATAARFIGRGDL